LGEWAERIYNWAGDLRKVFVYFNNDLGGHAIRNARRLRQMLDETTGTGSGYAA
jgi:uncharacterized protein YecE (DUF72 family)